MAVAYQSGLMSDFYRRQGQRRALTGLPSSYQETRGLLDPMLAYEAQKTHEASLLQQHTAEFDRQMSLQEKARKDQQTAGIIGGIGQIAQLPLAYGAAKGAGIIPKSFELLKPSTWGGTAASSTGAVGATGSTGLISGTAQGSIGPAVGGTTAQGMVLGGAAYPGVAGGTATAGAVGPTSAVAAEGAGLLGTAGTVAGPAGLAGSIGSLGGNLLGGALARRTGMHEKTAEDVGGVLGGVVSGALAGAAATSWSGPGAIIGGLIGGAIGAISSLF